MPEENGASTATETNGKSPAIHIPRPGAKQDIRQSIINDKHSVIPHVDTFAGKYNVVSKSYYIYWDEALRNSQINTLAMRADSYIEELLRHRQLPVVSLPWHIEIDDPEHPDQISISQTITKIISAIPGLKKMMVSLLDAIFYGRCGVQTQIGPARVAGNKWNSIVNNIPINGDKFRYKWDGTPGIVLYAGDRSPAQQKGDQANFLTKYEKYIEQTMLGPALFLNDPFLRDRFIIHNFQPADTDYLFEIEQAQAVFGMGLRSRLYWTWNMRTELLSWMFDALQRVGANGMLYGFYQSGNMQAQNEVISCLRQLVKDNVAAFPLPPSNNQSLADTIQRIEPSAVGYDVIYNLVQHFEGIMRRAFLGQDLSSESKPTGIGGGAAALQGEVRSDIMKYDSAMLGETMTDQPLRVIQRYNSWKYEGKVLPGDELPFTMTFKFDFDEGNAAERLQAAQALYEMGVPLDQDDVRKVAGFSPPKKKATMLVNPQIEQMAAQNEAGQPQFNSMNEHLKGIVGESKKAQQLGMGKPKPPTSRFAKSGDDCGHDEDGDFSKGNTCSDGSNEKDNLISISDYKDELPLYSDDDLKKELEKYATNEEFKKAIKWEMRNRKWDLANKEIEKTYQENLKSAGSSTSVILDSDERDKNSGTGKLVVHKSARDKGKWQLTYMSFDGKPAGHEVFDTKEDAIASASGKFVGRIQPYGDKSFRVVEKSKFSKEHEGSYVISSSTKTLTSSDVAQILADQHGNKMKGVPADYMQSKWVVSPSFKLVRNVPIWCLRPVKLVAPSDPSHSTGPIIVDAVKPKLRERFGSFLSCENFLILDGKHRYYAALRSGQTHIDCFVGEDILQEMRDYIRKYSGPRREFVEALEEVKSGKHDEKVSA